MSNMNNDLEEKSEIRINRKMRMWNKYRKYFFVLLAFIVVIVVGTLIINNINKGGEKPEPTVAEKESQTPFSINNNGSGTQAQTQAQSQEATQQASTEAPTQAPAGATYTVSGSASEVDLTSANFFSDSVFLGDAIATGINGYRFLDDDRVVATTAMATSNASQYVDSVMESNPSKVFIMLGLNDCNNGRDANTIVSNMKSIVSAIKAKNGSTQVYIVSVLPVTTAFESKEGISVKQSAINEINEGYKTAATTVGASYVDLAAAFKDNSGYLIDDSTTNGCNIKPGYYPFMLNGIAGAVK